MRAPDANTLLLSRAISHTCVGHGVGPHSDGATQRARIDPASPASLVFDPCYDVAGSAKMRPERFELPTF